MKKLLTILLLLIAFIGYGQQFNVSTHREAKTDTLDSFSGGQIYVQKKMFFTITPTMTADGDVVYLGYLNDRIDTLSGQNSVSLEIGDSLNNYWRGDRDNLVTGSNRILIGQSESIQLTDGSYGHIILSRNSGDTVTVEIASSDGTGTKGGIYIFPNQGISILDTTMHYSADFLAEQNNLDLLHTAAVRRFVNTFLGDSVHAKLDTGNLIATKSDLNGITGVTEDYVSSSIDSVDQATEISYTATTTTDWPGTDPPNVGVGLDSAGSRLTVLEAEVSGLGTSLNNRKLLGGSYLPWNMDTDSTKTGSLGTSSTGERVWRMSVMVYNNDSTEIKSLEFADGGGVNGGFTITPTFNPSSVSYGWTLYRKESGYFDDPDWNAATYFVEIEYTD